MMRDKTGKYRRIDDIERLVRSFESCTLPRCEWTHQAHLIVALWYLTHYPPLEATNCIRDRIQHYNRTHGIKTTKSSGYHETITLFWIQMVHQYLVVEGANHSLVELANNLIENYGNPGLTLEYYSKDLLMSQEARISWVEPNLKSLE